jgi:hypothetical protein
MLRNSLSRVSVYQLAEHERKQSSSLSSRRRLQAFDRAQAPTPAFNMSLDFAFELYDLAWRTAGKVD